MSNTVTLQVSKTETQNIIILKKRKLGKRIKWHPKVIDNEHLGRKKSKCCCSWNPSQCKTHNNEGVKDLNIPGNFGKKIKNNN